MRKIILHIGMPKTGTTSLQRNLFSRLESIDFFGRLNSKGKETAARDFLLGIRLAENHEMDSMVTEFVNSVYASKQDVVLISDEGILKDFVFASVIADRLKKYFPRARVIITIRNQISSIKSWYSGHRRFLKKTPLSYKNMHVPFRDYFKFVVADQRGDFKQFDYYNIVRSFSATFGKDNVHVLLFEEMVRGQGDFFSKLARILETPQDEIETLWRQALPQNARGSARMATYLSIRARLPLRSVSLGNVFMIPKGVREKFWAVLKRGEKAEPSLSRDDLELISQRFGAGNRRLAAEFDLPLSRWKYPGL